MNTQRRGYSTNYDDHVGLIHKFARKGFARLQAAGVVIDYEDVFQEMSLIYCRAADRYDPSKGFTFTAYLGSAIWMDFNQIADRLIKDQCGLGLVRIEQFSDEDDTMDSYSYIQDDGATPEEALICSRTFGDGMRILPTLERAIVGTLLRQVVQRVDGVTGEPIDRTVQYKNSTGKTVVAQESELSLSEIMRAMKLNKIQITAARKRIGKAFGVSI